MHQQMLIAAAGGLSQTVLSSVNKASDIILSNGNRDAESNTTAGGIVLSVSGKGAGKFYVECQLTKLSTSMASAFGLHQGISSLATFLGGDASGWATWVVNAARSTYHNNVQANSATTINPVVNIRARMAVDLDAGKVWLSQFGNTSWIGGGDPALGTSPTYTFTPSGTYYVALCPYHGVVTPSGNRNQLRLVLPGDWATAAPTGFEVWR